MWTKNKMGRRTGGSIMQNNDMLKELEQLKNRIAELETKLNIDKKQTLWRKLQRFADEHNEHELDWNDRNSEKWTITYNYETRKIDVLYNLVNRDFGQVYFTSREIAKKQ
jgi:hypothetical protein